MRYAILFILLTQSFLGYTQSRIDYPIFFIGEHKDVVKESLKRNFVVFADEVYPADTSTIPGTTLPPIRRLVVYEDEYEMIWGLDSNGIVKSQTLIPDLDNKQGVNEFVKWFNEDFVRVSDREWRHYTPGKIYKIRLEDFNLYFYMTLSED